MLLSAVLAFVCFYIARQRKRAGTEQVQPKKLAKTTDKRIFSRKQLVIMWLVAVIVCVFIWISSVASGSGVLKYERTNWKVYVVFRQKYPPPSPRTRYYYAVNWLRLSIIPVIIGGLLVITFSKGHSPEEKKAQRLKGNDHK